MRRIAICAPAVLVIACGGASDDTPPGTRAAERARPTVEEERDGLWLVDGDTRRRVTATRVGAYDFDSLAAKQREGEVILYWAAAPALSPDARTIAFATNREAVQDDARGQSIWLVDLATGAERALLVDEGRSYRPVGWLADDVVYIGDESGVWTIDTATQVRTQLSRGTWLAVAEDGDAVAVAENVPQDPRVSVVLPGDTVAVPAAPNGAGWLAQASFDSAGHLHLEASADSGRSRQRHVFDPRTGHLAPDD